MKVQVHATLGTILVHHHNKIALELTQEEAEDLLGILPSSIAEAKQWATDKKQYRIAELKKELAALESEELPRAAQ